ncbi:MAG: Gfo/Idh/MocA family oxidoreductase [Chloroflexota bacterium]
MTDKTTLNWGILATGGIATNMAQALNFIPQANLVAVASRSIDRAQQFADRWNIPYAYGSYEELVANPDIDVVYIGTPHPAHMDNILMSLNAGKHVLCEKPLTLNAAQAERCIAAAKANDRFLMEAVWMRFIPAIVKLRQLIAEGAIGDILMIHAHINMALSSNPRDRVLNPVLGGGALLDVGIYPLNFTTMLLGFPESYDAHVRLGETGVDTQETMLLRYPDGVAALLSAGVTADLPNDAVIKGSKGYIVVHEEFWNPRKLTVKQQNAEPDVIHLPYDSTGLNYEAVAVCEDIFAGRHDNAIMPLETTLKLLQMMDDLRGRWGVTYPMEA